MGGQSARVLWCRQLREETRVASECSRKEAVTPASSNQCGIRCCKGAGGWGQAATCRAHLGTGWPPCPMRAPPARRQSCMPLVGQHSRSRGVSC